MNIDNGKITTKSTEIYYGSAPHLAPIPDGFKAELLAADGSVVRTFTIFDPRVQFGDVIVNPRTDPQIQGVIDRQTSADFVVTFPFDRTVVGFRLYNPTDGALLSSVDLKPTMDTFFSSYPKDPDNPASYGLKAPANANPPGTSGSATMPSGQLWGILAIGSGAVLILVGAFASIRFLRVRPKSVLIVDDNTDIIEVIAIMLKMGGYTTRTATSGEECLRELESGVPDLILLDIGMEPMDGWETLKRIKKDPKTKGIPVIMLTARRLTPKDVEDYGICIEDYVVKPVTPQDLNDAILHVFLRRQMINEKIAAAKGTGIDRNELCECARLTRVVDVNKRLWDLLVKTYDLEEGSKGPESEFTLAIKNTEMKIRDQ
jgi:CheY-like chemotaxis protein